MSFIFGRRFIITPPPPPLYSKELSYIESTGTQYLSTGITCSLSQTCRIECDVAPNAISSTERWCGCNAYLQHSFSLTNGKCKIQHNGAVYDSVENNSRVKIKLDKVNNVTSLYLGDTKIGQKSWDDYGSIMVLIFALGNNQSGSVYSNQYAYGKLYGYKLYMDNSLTLDLIPVLDKDSVPCMYDKVAKQFYYNKGTGNFLYN